VRAVRKKRKVWLVLGGRSIGVASRPDNDPSRRVHAPVEPTKAEEKTVLWEKTKEERRADYIREKTVAAAPPPCSPKTIYVLANLVRQPSTERSHAILTHNIKLGIQPLCDSAFADIKSKVTLNNVVDEVFSWVTAG
jgi:hypothetical protein